MAKYLKPQTPLQHYSGDYIYPITSVDQVLTSNGERLNANLISIDLKNSVDSDKVVLGTQITPVSIEGGGTNATNPTDARKNLEITPENIGAMKMELLWENASPLSSFSHQIILLDWSQFDRIKVEGDLLPNYNAFIEHDLNAEKEIGCEFLYGGTTSIFTRRCVLVDDGLEIQHGYQTSYSGSSQQDDTIYIPRRIYGIKGVSK